MKFNKLLIVGMLMLVALASGVYGACTTPTATTNIYGSQTLCNSGSPYYLNDTGNGILRISAHNVRLDCNGTVFIGNGSGVGIVQLSNNQNNTYHNCTFINYERGLSAQSNKNITVSNTNFINSTSFGIYVKNMNILTLDNINSSGCSGEHGIYVDSADGQTRNVTIKDSYFMNNSNAGIHMNYGNSDFVYNVSVYNTYITNNHGFGIQFWTPKDSLFYNNTFENNGLEALRFAYGNATYFARDNLIFNNIFNNNCVDCSESSNIKIGNYSYNNTVFSNTYLDSTKEIITFKENNDVMFKYNETYNKNLLINFENKYNFTLNFNGRKDFKVRNDTIELYNLAGISSYIYNVTSTPNTLISYLDANVNITLSSGDIIQTTYSLVETGFCQDGIDNDGNGLTDCSDPACKGGEYCGLTNGDAQEGIIQTRSSAFAALGILTVVIIVIVAFALVNAIQGGDHETILAVAITSLIVAVIIILAYYVLGMVSSSLI